MSIRPEAKSYLDKTFLPLFEAIHIKKSQSKILEALGYKNVTSSQSFVIQMGNVFEEFWNIVISDSTTAKNLKKQDGTTRIALEGETTKKRKAEKTRQVDGLFQVNNQYYYLELKCNLSFDSEKKPSSEAKIKKIKELVSIKYNSDVHACYIVPCVQYITEDLQKQVDDPNINVHGVDWLITTINTKHLFTSDEFMYYLREVIGPLYKIKMGF